MKSNITIVTGYFIMPSKNSPEVYKEWMKNFLSLDECMVIFTDKYTYNYIKNLRDPSNTHIIVTSIEKFEVYKYLNYWEYCKKIDREQHLHSKELYMIWNEKSFFLDRAIKINIFNSDYFFWMDIGSIRNSKMLTDLTKFSCEGIPKNKTILSKISNYILNPKLNNVGISEDLQNNNLNSCHVINYIQGGFFGGHTTALKEWIKLYKEELKLFVSTGTFGGKDQYIMNNMSLKFQARIHILKPKVYTNFCTWWSFLVRMNNLVGNM
jgi:hypothetical protein